MQNLVDGRLDTKQREMLITPGLYTAAINELMTYNKIQYTETYYKSVHLISITERDLSNHKIGKFRKNVGRLMTQIVPVLFSNLLISSLILVNLVLLILQFY